MFHCNSWVQERHNPSVCIWTNNVDIKTLTRFLYYWHLMQGIHSTPVESPHKRTLMQSFRQTVSLLLACRSYWKNSQMVSEMRCFNGYLDVLPQATGQQYLIWELDNIFEVVIIFEELYGWITRLWCIGCNITNFTNRQTHWSWPGLHE